MMPIAIGVSIGGFQVVCEEGEGESVVGHVTENQPVISCRNAMSQDAVADAECVAFGPRLEGKAGIGQAERARINVVVHAVERQCRAREGLRPHRQGEVQAQGHQEETCLSPNAV